MDNLEKKLVLCLVMAVAIVIFIPFYWSRESTRQAAAMTRIHEESVQKGKAAFVTACGTCHGQQAQGAVGPALAGKDATLVQKTVRSGKGIMPAFTSSQISNDELADIGLFLGSLPALPSIPRATPTPTPTTTPSPTPTPTTTASTPSPSKPADLVGLGEELYQRKASGVGCAGCHGTDAYGSIGPNIRGSSVKEVTDALQTVAAMNFFKLTDDEVKAISAYLKYLETQR